MDNTRVDRELESRDEFQRPDSWKPASLLPEFKKVPGWAYRWIRTSVMNEADNLNVSSKMREGWEPVKLADHPEMKLMVDQNSRFKDGVEIGGLLLCKKSGFRLSTPRNIQSVRSAKRNMKRWEIYSGCCNSRRESSFS